MKLNQIHSPQAFFGDVNHSLSQEIEQLRSENAALKNRLAIRSIHHPTSLKIEPPDLEWKIDKTEKKIHLVSDQFIQKIDSILSIKTEQSVEKIPINFSENYFQNLSTQTTPHLTSEYLQRRTLALEDLIRQQTQNPADLNSIFQQITKTVAHTIEAVKHISFWLNIKQDTGLEELFNLHEISVNNQLTDRYIGWNLYDHNPLDQHKAMNQCPPESQWINLQTVSGNISFSKSFHADSPESIKILKIPIKCAEEKIGFLRVEQETSAEQWTEEDQSFLECLANLVSIAIERLRSKHLEQQLSTENDQLKAKFNQKTSQLQTTREKRQSQTAKAQKLEFALQEAENQVQTALSAKRTFLTKISQEFSTPIHAIIGYSDLLCEEMLQQGQVNWLKDVQIIRQEGYQLLHIIDSILDLVRIEAKQMSLNLDIFDPVHVIQGVVENLVPIAEKNHNQLKIHYGRNLGLMHSDLGKLQKILHHLLENALKFTEGGQIKLTIRRQGNWMNFDLTDSGIGISTEQQQCLFEAFTSEDNSRCRRAGGSGLGLTICRHLCEMMGGEIGVSSQLGQGSTFTLRLKAQVEEVLVHDPNPA